MNTQETAQSTEPDADVPTSTSGRKPLTDAQKVAKAAKDRDRRAMLKANSTQETAAEALARKENAKAEAQRAASPTGELPAETAMRVAATKTPPKAPINAKAKTPSKAVVKPQEASMAQMVSDMLEPPKAPKAVKKAAAPVAKTGPTDASKAAFAAKFAKGDTIRFLAFRVQTSVRSAKDAPLSVDQLSERMNVPASLINQAIELLKTEKRIKVRSKGGLEVYDKLPPKTA